MSFTFHSNNRKYYKTFLQVELKRIWIEEYENQNLEENQQVCSMKNILFILTYFLIQSGWSENLTCTSKKLASIKKGKVTKIVVENISKVGPFSQGAVKF